MRIVAGEWKGRPLHVPRDATFRPTTDRVRESVFNILAGRISWNGANVCDLYAGSGGLGLEALSRGAASATFVERSPRNLAVLQRNITTLDAAERCVVLRQEVERFSRGATPCFDIVFADPPYASFSATLLLENIASLLRTGGIAVIEHGNLQPLGAHSRLAAIDERSYGSTTISMFQSLDGEAS
ncbi:MAG: 16S rRNA (guanine(966)-N(2))-methyltransferase RsmD [Bacteroidota bacterium]|nr:16S rRNA (guanine(966)-N(2))-methyltransferase RsmD [Bacteroidota bacterium]